MSKRLQQTRPGARPTSRVRLASIVLLGLLIAAPVAEAQSVGAEANADAKRYCASIAKAASEARFAWQTQKLAELETRIKGRIQDLDTRTAALRDWIEKREALEKKAGEKLVGIYSKMRPETAATQITMLDDDMAAAVLGQLSPRQASAIFNEIVPERAGKLAGLIAGTLPAGEKKL